MGGHGRIQDLRNSMADASVLSRSILLIAGVAALIPVGTLFLISHVVATASVVTEPASFVNYELLETIVVPANGEVAMSKNVLEKGITYWLIAKGTATIGGPGCVGCEFGDAEYGYGGIDSISANNCGNSPSGVDLGIGINDVTNSNSKQPYWGPPNLSSFTYVKYFIGEGTSITVNYHDCNYADNIGSLTVQVYQPAPKPNVATTTTVVFTESATSTMVLRLTSSVTVTNVVTSTITIPPGPFDPIPTLIFGGVSGAGLVGAAFFLYAEGKNNVIRTLGDSIKRNMLDDLDNQARPRTLNLDDLKQVADKIGDSRELIGELENLYKEAKTELDRTKITDEAVRRIKRNIDQVDSFLSLLTGIQTSLIRSERPSDEVLMLASREMKRVQNDLDQINDAITSLNTWLETAYARIAKFGSVADGYKDLALNVGFAADELKKPTVVGLTDVIEKISEARDAISEQLRKISRAAYESVTATISPSRVSRAVPTAAGGTKICATCGNRIPAASQFCPACGTKQ